MKKIRWGICGSGSIASAFVHDLALLPEAEVTAVWSKTRANAQTFAARFGIPNCPIDFQHLLDDPTIDIVYIGLPHTLHYEMSLCALNAGKAVLCEKPFTINQSQSAHLIAVARKKNLFLMEAMWTHFFPLMIRLRELIDSGLIGEVLHIEVDFGFRTAYDPNSRLFDPALGGGALLDVGIYPLSLVYKLLGAPIDMQVTGHLCPSGVDDQNAVIYKTESGATAVFSSATRVNTPHEALVCGSKGLIKVLSPWWKPSRMMVSIEGCDSYTIDIPYEGRGYHFEAKAVMDSMSAGHLENEIMPLDESGEVMKLLDLIRSTLGVRYPEEAEDLTPTLGQAQCCPSPTRPEE